MKDKSFGSIARKLMLPVILVASSCAVSWQATAKQTADTLKLNDLVETSSGNFMIPVNQQDDKTLDLSTMWNTPQIKPHSLNYTDVWWLHLVHLYDNTSEYYAAHTHRYEVFFWDENDYKNYKDFNPPSLYFKVKRSSLLPLKPGEEDRAVIRKQLVVEYNEKWKIKVLWDENWEYNDDLLLLQHIKKLIEREVNLDEVKEYFADLAKRLWLIED